METIIIAFVAFYIGFKASEFVHVASFKKILDDLNISGEDLKRLAKIDGSITNDPESKDTPMTEVDIRIEQHQGLLYVYELKGDRFVTQGQDADEIMQRLIEVYPEGTRVLCDRDHGGLILNDAAERIKARTT